MAIDFTRQGLLRFLEASQPIIGNMASLSSVRAYFDRPRITIASSSYSGTDSSFSIALDLQRDQMRVEPFPGQNSLALSLFNILYGITEGEIEGGVLQVESSGQQLSTSSIFEAAIIQNIELVSLTPEDVAKVANLTISAQAKARITAALEQGKSIIVPTASVTISGVQTIGWYELDPTTGEMLAMLEDGTHGADIEFVADEGVDVAFISEVEEGLNVPALRALGARINQIVDAKVEKELKQQDIEFGFGFGHLEEFIDAILAAAEGHLNIPAVVFKAFALGVLEWLLLLDPPVSPFLGNTSIPFPPESGPSLASAQQIITNLSPGMVNGNVQSTSVSAWNQLAATWATDSTSGLLTRSLNASSATVIDASGKIVGVGAIGLSAASDLATTVSGNQMFSVSGKGKLSFYDTSESSLGVSGDWEDYSATVTGKVFITLTTDSLTISGQTLPAGTYTITTNSATLTGSGATSSPNFAGSVSINATGSSINLGPGTGNLSVGGKPLNPEYETTLDSYNGTISVSANGDGTDSVSLNGHTGNVLQVSSSPTTLTTDQNTPITFATNVQTSLADTYNLTANAPAGWTVSIDGKGNVTATPAPGLQSGTYPIQIIAQSQTDSNLVAQTTIDVTIKATQPGINFTVASDPLFTVPFNGAQLPTAFGASLQNPGPSADTYNLSFSNIPSGFTLLDSGTSVTVPAGKTGILGLYLQPNAGQTIPAPGTQESFTVTATSTTDPTLTQTKNVTFTVPKIDAVTVSASPSSLSTSPGVPITDTVTITNVGNAEEGNIALTDTLPSGLTLTGLAPVSLAVGQTTTETITLTPDASTPLNSTLDATITATFGSSSSPATQTVQIPLLVEVPGAAAIANAAIAAGQLGNTNLADRLNDLSTALTNLVQNPTSAVYKSQALASLDAVSGLMNSDPFLSVITGALANDQSALAQASSASAIQAALKQLGTDLGTIGTRLSDEAAHGFTLSLMNSDLVGQPQQPAVEGVVLQNSGTQTTTYNLSLAGLPAGVTGTLNQTSITLGPGQTTFLALGASSLNATLTSTSATQIPSFNFTITAVAEGAPEIAQTATGGFSARGNFVQVVAVTPNPTFTNPGGQVDVSAQILNAVNRQQQAKVSYVVTDAGGNVLFRSQPVTTTLNVLSTLSTVDLGKLDTTGFALGDDTITVTVAKASGNPIPARPPRAPC